MTHFLFHPDPQMKRALQAMLNNSGSDDEAAIVPLRGIENRVGDNYCYLNSVVQMIVRCRALRRELATVKAPTIVVEDVSRPRPISEIETEAELDDADTNVLLDKEWKSADSRPKPKPVPSPPEAPPCAALAMRETVAQYMRKDNLNALQIPFLRRLVAHAANTFARGNMNDASELFEKLMHIVDRDMWWHAKGPLGDAPETGCVPDEKLLEDCSDLDHGVSGIGRAVGYGFNQQWSCGWDGCSERLVQKSKCHLEYVCRLLVYPMLYDQEAKPRYSYEDLPPQYESFQQIVSGSVLRNETFVCPTCGERAEVQSSRRWLPGSMSAFHLLWHRIPTPIETNMFLLRVLEDSAAVGGVWDAVSGVSPVLSLSDHHLPSASSKLCRLAGIVVFHGSHYVAIVRNEHNDWSVMNDAKPVEKLEQWEDVVLYIIKKRFAPLMLFYDMPSNQNGGGSRNEFFTASPRPTWNAQDIRERLRPPAPPRPSLTLKSKTNPPQVGQRRSTEHFYPADKINLGCMSAEREVVEVQQVDEDDMEDERGEYTFPDLNTMVQQGKAPSLNRKRSRTSPPCIQREDPGDSPIGRSQLEQVREVTGDQFADSQILDALKRHRNKIEATIMFLIDPPSEPEAAWGDAVKRGTSIANRPHPKYSHEVVLSASCSGDVLAAITGDSAPSFMCDPAARLSDVLAQAKAGVTEGRHHVTQQRNERRAPLSSPREVQLKIFSGKHFYLVLNGADNEKSLRTQLREVIKYFGGLVNTAPSGKAKFDNNSEYVLTTRPTLERIARAGMLHRQEYSWLRDFFENREFLVLDAIMVAGRCADVKRESENRDTEDSRRRVNQLYRVLDDCQIRGVMKEDSLKMLIAISKKVKNAPVVRDLEAGLRFAQGVHHGAPPLAEDIDDDSD